MCPDGWCNGPKPASTSSPALLSRLHIEPSRKKYFRCFNLEDMTVEGRVQEELQTLTYAPH
ncbi:hypothetical protein NQZ68_010829 [Dissostichus eleginoides]|nr:hypothetical protein NQZ68_010829 [Dissostichus eleginoides]